MNCKADDCFGWRGQTYETKYSKETKVTSKMKAFFNLPQGVTFVWEKPAGGDFPRKSAARRKYFDGILMAFWVFAKGKYTP